MAQIDVSLYQPKTNYRQQSGECYLCIGRFPIGLCSVRKHITNPCRKWRSGCRRGGWQLGGSPRGVIVIYLLASWGSGKQAALVAFGRRPLPRATAVALISTNSTAGSGRICCGFEVMVRFCELNVLLNRAWTASWHLGPKQTCEAQQRDHLSNQPRRFEGFYHSVVEFLYVQFKFHV